MARRQAPRLKKSMYPKIWSAILILAILGVGFKMFDVVRKRIILERQAENLEAEIKKVQARSDELEKQLGRLQDPQALEGEARTRLNAQKEGEKLVVLVATPTQDVSTSSENNNSSWLVGLLSKPLSWFKYIFEK